MAKRGNPLTATGGFVEFYDRHAEALVVFFARQVLDGELALELASETFAKAFASRAKFRGRAEEESAAWLYAIARRQLANYFRRGYAERRALSKLAIEPPGVTELDLARIDELASLREVRESVANALGQISPEQRAAVNLRVVRELSYAEVASSLGIDQDAARARVSRGLRALAEILESRPRPGEATL